MTRRTPLTAVTVLVVLFASMFAGGSPASANHSSSHYVVSHDGSAYRAASLATTYTGTLKSVVESAVANLNSSGGGTVTFTSGVFDLGSEWFRFRNVLTDITFEGQGIDVTVIRNSTTIAADTEPFNFRGTNRVTIRDLTVSAGGPPRTTSDAIDFDRGNNSLVERVKITASRGKGIIFDGKDIDPDGTPWVSEGNLVRDCIIEGTNNDGIQFLASSNNRVEGCTIRNVVGDGIEIRKSQSTALQPNKKSNGNVLIGNVIDRAGENGIRVTSSDNNRVTGNTVTNSSILVSNLDGIRLSQENSITCDDNIVDANTATDTQPVKTQAYGLHISTSSCHRTVVGSNNFAGNKTGAIRDLGTDTRYEVTDTTAPTTPTNLAATAVNPTRVDLSWTASTDNIGVTGYDVFRNGIFLVAVGATTTYQDTSVLPATAYSYEVRAFDAAANRSGFSNAAPVTTPTATTLSFTPVDDAHVRAGQPTTNFGATGGLSVDNSPVKHILLKFTVAGIGAGTVSSAKLRIYCTNPASDGGQVRRVPNNLWSESSVTWNTAPASDSALLATVGAVSANAWYEVNVTSLITGDGTYSIRVSSTSSNGADYVSSEGTASLRPALVVTTSGGGPPDTQAPSTPTGLTATATNPNQVGLAWTASIDNVGVTGYEIRRNGAVLTSVGAVINYQDNTVAPATTYAYQVRAVDAAGNWSGLSNTATVTTPGGTAPDVTPPSAPTNLGATATSPTSVDLSWTAATDAVGVTGYDIYRNSGLLITIGAQTTYTDLAVSAGSTYTYQVSARDAAGNVSAPSNAAQVTTPASGTLLFGDDFETGNLSKWTTVSGLVVQTQEVFAGGYAARATSSGAASWAWRQLASGQTELFYRLRFKLISAGPQTIYLLKFRNATGGALLGVYVSSTNKLSHRNDVAGLSTSSTTTVGLGTWHELQVRIRINGATGQSEVWYDGASVAALAKTFDLGTVPVGRIQLGDNAAATYDIAFDNVELSTQFLP